MRIFYYCRTGVHTSLIAAGIHLGWLPRHRTAWETEILKLPYFHQIAYQALGTPLLLGYDQWNNQIYTFGTWSETEVVPKAVFSLMKTFGIGPDQYRLVDVLAIESKLTVYGEILALRLRMDKYGKQLALRGLRRSYPQVVQLVQHIRNEFEA